MGVYMKIGFGFWVLGSGNGERGWGWIPVPPPVHCSLFTTHHSPLTLHFSLLFLKKLFPLLYFFSIIFKFEIIPVFNYVLRNFNIFKGFELLYYKRL